nr:hypothetical protein [Tanacetum cinerariifolium]
EDYGRQSALKGFSQPLVNKVVLIVFYNVICASKEDGGSNLDTLSDIRNLDCLFTCIAQNAMR